jgi:hypothetical protein
MLWLLAQSGATLSQPAEPSVEARNAYTVRLGSKHPVKPTDDDHEKAEDEQENPKAIGPAIFGKKLKLGKRLSIGHGALR